MRRLMMIVLSVALGTFALPVRGLSKPAGAAQGRRVRLTLRDGSSQSVRLEGVGCDRAICSRVAINGGVSLDRLDAIREVCDGHAQFVFSDGTERGITVIPDNRVLYVTGADGRARKIHLDAVTSLRFMSRASQ